MDNVFVLTRKFVVLSGIGLSKVIGRRTRIGAYRANVGVNRNVVEGVDKMAECRFSVTDLERLREAVKAKRKVLDERYKDFAICSGVVSWKIDEIPANLKVYLDCNAIRYLSR